MEEFFQIAFHNAKISRRDSMKTMKLTTLACMATALFFLNVSGAQTSFTNTLNQNIPDGSPIGLVSSATVSGLVGNISSMSVNLDITGGFNGNLYAYLLGPNGADAVLLNLAGVSSTNAFGYADSGFNITLTDGAPDIHFYQTGSYTLNSGQLTGTWSPDGRNISPASAASAFDPAGVYGLDAFSVFDNINPNGQWTLFIADLSNGGGQSVFVNWSLTIVTVPEPQTWMLMIGGAGVLLALRRRRKT